MQGISDAELVAQWIIARAAGQSLKEFATRFGRSEKAMDSALYKARKRIAEGRPKKGKDEQPGTKQIQPQESPAKKVTDVTEGNERTVTYVGPDIRTLQQLIDYCQIDESKWLIYRHEINKWSVGAKTGKQSIKDGESWFVEQQITVAPLFQVKAFMVPRQPEAVKPVLQPVTVSAGIAPTTNRTGEGLRRELIIMDAQIGFRRDLQTGALDPFHDRAALDIALQIAQDGRFDGITFVGDWLDWTMWTERFAREPEFYFTTQPAVIEGAWWLMQFRQAQPQAQARMIDSNHEIRVKNTLQAHILDAYDLKPGLGYDIQYPALSVPNLLALDTLGIEWIAGYPDACVELNKEIIVTHGSVARSGLGDTAKAIADSSPVSVVFGHIHRRERATRTEYRTNRTITAVSFGCLCRIDGVVPGHDLRQNWQQGLGVIEYTADGYHAEIEIPIERGRAVYNGKIYTARERLEDLERDTGRKF